jgi:hypothetical protein
MEGASGIHGSRIRIEWADGKVSEWCPPTDGTPVTMHGTLQSLDLDSSKETDLMLRVLLSEMLQVDIGSRMSNLQLSRAAPCRLTSTNDGSTSFAMESPKGRTLYGAFDLLDKLSARGMALEIPAKVGGDTYCVKFSRAAGGELFMLGPTARPDDSPWLVLSCLRGMAGKELLSASIVTKKIFGEH